MREFRLDARNGDQGSMTRDEYAGERARRSMSHDSMAMATCRQACGRRARAFGTTGWPTVRRANLGIESHTLVGES